MNKKINMVTTAFFFFFFFSSSSSSCLVLLLTSFHFVQSLSSKRDSLSGIIVICIILYYSIVVVCFLIGKQKYSKLLVSGSILAKEYSWEFYITSACRFVDRSYLIFPTSVLNSVYCLTNRLTNSTEHCPAWESNNTSSGNQQIPCFLEPCSSLSCSPCPCPELN